MIAGTWQNALFEATFLGGWKLNDVKKVAKWCNLYCFETASWVKCKSFNAVSAKNEANGVDGGGGGEDIDKTSNWEKEDIKLSLYSKILTMFIILLIIYG